MAFRDPAALVFLASPVQVTCLGWAKCHGSASSGGARGGGLHSLLVG